MNDQGHVAVLSLVLGVGLILFAVLVADGGRVLAGRARADEHAHAAARAGAGALDASALLQGRVELDPETAEQRAEAFLTDLGVHGVVTIRAGEVLVRVDEEVELAVASLFGGRTVTVSGSGSARPAIGVGAEGDVVIGGSR